LQSGKVARKHIRKSDYSMWIKKVDSGILEYLLRKSQNFVHGFVLLIARKRQQWATGKVFCRFPVSPVPLEAATAFKCSKQQNLLSF
jgi:hypothetical protein